MFTGVSSADIGHLLPAQGNKGKSKRYVQDFCLKTAAGIFSSQPLFLTAGSDSEYYFRFLVMLLFNILIVFFFLIGVTHLPLLLLKGLKVSALATPLTGSSGDTLHRKSILILKGPESFLTSCQRGKKGLLVFLTLGKFQFGQRLCCSK